MNFSLEKRVYNFSITVFKISVVTGFTDSFNNHNHNYFKQKLLMYKKIPTTEINKSAYQK